jgi:hypothetical protein
MIDVPTLKKKTAIHDNIEEKLIYPEIKAAQDLFILPMLGTALYNKILTDINTNALSGDYKTLVDDYLVDALCNYVLAELPIGLNYQFWNKGVASKTTDNSSNPSMGELFDIANKYKNRAEAYGKKAMYYLKQQASQGKFPEYLNPGSGIDTIVPDRNAYSNPIYLGDEQRDYRTYEQKYQGNIPNC